MQERLAALEQLCAAQQERLAALEQYSVAQHEAYQLLATAAAALARQVALG
jgi:hypothetical protein